MQEQFVKKAEKKKTPNMNCALNFTSVKKGLSNISALSDSGGAGKTESAKESNQVSVNVTSGVRLVYVPKFLSQNENFFFI